VCPWTACASPPRESIAELKLLAEEAMATGDPDAARRTWELVRPRMHDLMATETRRNVQPSRNSAFVVYNTLELQMRNVAHRIEGGGVCLHRIRFEVSELLSRAHRSSRRAASTSIRPRVQADTVRPRIAAAMMPAKAPFTTLEFIGLSLAPARKPTGSRTGSVDRAGRARLAAEETKDLLIS
jgi:hypothetical protein